ncbi:MAG: EpsG family protein, partial [Bacteroidaceae bacterium]
MADKEGYELFFRFPNNFGKRFELGFRFLTTLIKRLGAGLTFFFFFFAAISIALKLWAIRKMTTLLWGSLAIYV